MIKPYELGLIMKQLSNKRSLLQKEALFNPKVKGELRKSVGIDVTEDYRSSTW